MSTIDLLFLRNAPKISQKETLPRAGFSPSYHSVTHIISVGLEVCRINSVAACVASGLRPYLSNTAPQGVYEYD